MDPFEWPLFSNFALSALENRHSPAKISVGRRFPTSAATARSSGSFVMSVVDALHHAVFENCVMAHSPRWSARGFYAGGSYRPCCAVVVAAERFHGVRR